MQILDLLTEAVTGLAALAQRTRLEAFLVLVREGRSGMPQGELARRLKIPAQTLSFHLKQLASARLVRTEREGTTIHYSVDFDEAGRLLSFLSQNCCAGVGQKSKKPNSRDAQRRH